MKHSPAFLKLVEEVMPRVKEIGVEEVAFLLFPPPEGGRVAVGREGVGADAEVTPSRSTKDMRSACLSRAASPLKGEAVLIDVREDHEFAAGHIPGAVHMGRGIIERDIEVKIPDKNAKLILYCGGGYRSALSADNLQKMGYTDVYSLAGGWRGWCEQGLERHGN